MLVKVENLHSQMCGSNSLKNSKSVCVIYNKLSFVSRDLINTVVSSEWGGGAGGREKTERGREGQGGVHTMCCCSCVEIINRPANYSNTTLQAAAPWAPKVPKVFPFIDSKPSRGLYIQVSYRGRRKKKTLEDQKGKAAEQYGSYRSTGFVTRVRLFSLCVQGISCKAGRFRVSRFFPSKRVSEGNEIAGLDEVL